VAQAIAGVVIAVTAPFHVAEAHSATYPEQPADASLHAPAPTFTHPPSTAAQRRTDPAETKQLSAPTQHRRDYLCGQVAEGPPLSNCSLLTCVGSASTRLPCT
jgi:hypothetical protein